MTSSMAGGAARFLPKVVHQACFGLGLLRPRVSSSDVCLLNFAVLCALASWERRRVVSAAIVAPAGPCVAATSLLHVL